MSSGRGRNGDGHIHEGAPAETTEDNTGLAITYCLHESLSLRTRSSEKVKEKKKTKTKIINPRVTSLQYIWSAHPSQWYPGFMQHMEYPPWPGHWWETSASCQDWDEWNLMTNGEKVQTIDSGFLLPCPVCLHSDSASALLVLLSLIRSARLEWNILRLRKKITLWTH